MQDYVLILAGILPVTRRLVRNYEMNLRQSYSVFSNKEIKHRVSLTPEAFGTENVDK